MLDTNVVVSGLLNPHGAPGRLIDLVLLERLWPLYDDRIFDEYRDVLRRERFGFQEADVDALLDHVSAVGEHLTAPPLPVTLPDRDDLPFLEVAAAGGAGTLVTGNVQDFRPIEGSRPVTVLPPRDLLDAIREAGDG